MNDAVCRWFCDLQNDQGRSRAETRMLKIFIGKKRDESN